MSGTLNQRPAVELSLLHGWAMNREVFNPFVAGLISRYGVSAYDLPGHGKAAWHDESFTQQIDRLNQRLESSVLVGWSLGGLWAIQLAKTFPEKYPAVVLIASTPAFVEKMNWQHAMKSAVVEAFCEGLIYNWQRSVRKFISLQLQGSQHQRQYAKQMMDLVLSGGEPQHQALIEGMQSLLEDDLRGTLTGLSQPVLAVFGGRDQLVPVQVAGCIHQLNPRIRVECIDDASHAPFLTHPQQCFNLIDEFVESIPAG